MEKSQRPKASTPENGVDMISNLPDPILSVILSRLPTTEEVVRTSILSTRWRYVWTSTSSLDINCSRGLKTPSKFRKNQFKEFVYWVLINKTLDLQGFRLCCLHYYNSSTVWRWIHAAVMRKVKLLDLTFCPNEEDEVVKLPHCLVNCESLEGLRLCLLRSPLSFPDFTGFPTLRVLELNNVEFVDDDLVEEFLGSCPLLEDLSLIDCLLNKLEILCISCPNLKNLTIDNRKLDFSREADEEGGFYLYENEGLCNGLEISCPKLVFLQYAGHMAYEFAFENLDSLKKAVIYPEDMAQKELSFESLGDTICELFAGVSHVESLFLNLYFIQAINAARDPYGDFPASLPNLKTLEIITTIDAYTMNVVIRILKCSPNLKSLHLTILEEIFWPECWELDGFLTHHLKRVEFLEFDSGERKLDMARFLLEHGYALEEMVFSWINISNYDSKSMKVMEKMSKFHKASSTVKLITMLKEE